jgi:three-Cys-motif partner protein
LRTRRTPAKSSCVVLNINLWKDDLGLWSYEVEWEESPGSQLEAAASTRQKDALTTTRPDLDVHVYPQDFNVGVDSILKENVIGEREATFCLLDQRTFECSWTTVAKLAGFKAPHKIELFYFLANKWLDRAMGKKNPLDLERWWGSSERSSATCGVSPPVQN